MKGRRVERTRVPRKRYALSSAIGGPLPPDVANLYAALRPRADGVRTKDAALFEALLPILFKLKLEEQQVVLALLKRVKLPRTRKKKFDDEALLDEMEPLVKAGAAPETVALGFVDRAGGGGTPQSRAKRLAREYRERAKRERPNFAEEKRAALEKWNARVKAIMRRLAQVV